MSHKRTFLILTSDSGFGHRSSANAIAKAIMLRHPNEAITQVVNPIFRQSVATFLRKAELNYDQTVKDYPSWYRFFYEISDKRSVSSIVENTLSMVLQRSIQDLIDGMRPSAIISTNQMFNAPVGNLLEKCKEEIPFHTVITDLADVHAMWFNNAPDRFFVASELVKAKAIASGIEPGRIVISGIPVDPLFGLTRESGSTMRSKLGLDPQMTTLLVVGSPRVSGIFEHLQMLETVRHVFQVVVIAGGNNDLYDCVQQREWSFPIHVENYVNNIPEWMLASDVLITKAGGAILSEGMAAGLPIIMIDCLPGQEEGNLRFIVDQGAGVVVNHPAVFSKLINNWLKKDRELLQIYAMNSHCLGHPDSAILIADALWKAVQKRESDTAHRQRCLSTSG